MSNAPHSKLGIGDSARGPQASSSMQWRAAGAQFYPGGAYEQLREISRRGRGPKGYQRSDERLMEVIHERLAHDAFIDARNVTVDVQNGEVTLSGSVDNRQQKYAIEDAIADVFGIREVHNRLSVGGPELEDRLSGL